MIRVHKTQISVEQKDALQGPSLVPNKKPNEVNIRENISAILHDAYQNNTSQVILTTDKIEQHEFPVLGYAKITAQELMKHCRRSSHLESVVIETVDKKVFDIFDKEIHGYISHFQDELGLEPYVTTDIIVELPEGLVIIERSNPPYGWALPGGFLDPGESLEQAAAREVKEETSLELKNMRQFHTYSDPKRDPRFHTITTVFIGEGVGKPQFGDDAKGLQVVPYDQLLNRDYAFDHKQVIEQYLKQKEG